MSTRKCVVIVGVVAIALGVTMAAFGQPAAGTQPEGGRRGAGVGPGGRFGMNREVQLKAIAAIQEQLGKLKAALEAPMPGLPEGKSPQDLSDEEKAKMTEARTKRRAEQVQVVAAIEQEMTKLKGIGQLRTEQEESMVPLKEILASAQKEQAKETAGKVEQLIAQRQKAWEDKMKSLGFDPAAMPGGGRRGGAGGPGGGAGGGAGGPGGGTGGPGGGPPGGGQ